MFGIPDRSPFDWTFRLFGIDVRVHPLFWLGAAFLGGNWLQFGLIYLVIWVIAVLVSILLHEFGHALAFQIFGVHSMIVLVLAFGLTIPSSYIADRWRRIVVSLAGPAAGFLLAGVIYLVRENTDPLQMSKYLFLLLYFLFWINLVWGIFNLLPVYPLDGGRVSEELFTWGLGRKGRRMALQLSIGVAALVVIYSLACVSRNPEFLAMLPDWLPRGSTWTAVLFGLLGYYSYQELQNVSWTDSHWDR